MAAARTAGRPGPSALRRRRSGRSRKYRAGRYLRNVAPGAVTATMQRRQRSSRPHAGSVDPSWWTSRRASPGAPRLLVWGSTSGAAVGAPPTIHRPGRQQCCPLSASS